MGTVARDPGPVEAASVDEAEVRRAVAALFSPDEHYELRGLPSGRSRCVAGYDIAGIIAAARLFADDRGTYYTLNPVDPALGDRGARVADIVRRRHFLVDVDPVKADPDGSATQVEKDHAKWLGDQILATLNTLGWPFPIVIDSGNGAHLAYRVDLPNDDETRKLFGRALKALALAHDTEHAKVDTKVHNASRIAKLPGTWARKGPDTADRPHRLCKLVAVPGEAQVVPLEKFVELAGAEPEKGAARPSVNGEHGTSYALAALHGETAKVIAAGPGSRNSQLFESALKLAGYVQSGELGRSLVEYSLTNAGRLVGLDDAEIARALSNGLDAGSSAPKHTPSKNGDSVRSILSVPCGDEEWEEPATPESCPAEPFPLDVLPVSLRELCVAAAGSFQCPVDYFAAAAIGLAGGVIGRSVNLSVTATYEVAPNLALAIVGPPGSKKSPALKLMAGPLWDVDRKLREEHKADKAAWRDRKKQGAEEEPPAPRHLTMDDTTREAFAAALHDNPRGLVLIKDELTGWVASLNAYRKGLGDDKQFWMSLNTGSPVKVTRKGNDREAILIPRPCGAVVGCLTPGTLPTLRLSHAEDGWLDRLTFSFPEPSGARRRWRRAGEIPPGLVEDWSNAVKALWGRGMVREPDTGRLRPYFVRLSAGAESLYAEWFDAHQAEQEDPDFPDFLRGPWSKLEGYCLRLALVVAQLHRAYDPEPPPDPGPVSELEMLGARKLAGYFKSHYRRALAVLSGRDATLPRPAADVLRWIREECLHDFTGREVLRRFRWMTDRDRDRALSPLLGRRYIRVRPKSADEQRGPGRPPQTYDVNPTTWDKKDRKDKIG